MDELCEKLSGKIDVLVINAGMAIVDRCLRVCASAQSKHTLELIGSGACVHALANHVGRVPHELQTIYHTAKWLQATLTSGTR